MDEEKEEITETKRAEKEKSEKEDDKSTKPSRMCHARMSVVSRQKQKVDADVYMAKQSISEILQWITIEVLTARPSEPIKFIRELFNDESLDLDSIRKVNNAGISILRNTLNRENDKLRATVNLFFSLSLCLCLKTHFIIIYYRML